MSRKLIGRGGLVLALLLTMALPVGAQGTITGSIQGMVKDTDGKVLPGAAVTALSEALVAGRLVAVSDERGSYRFPSLPVGAYVIQVELDGFQTVRQEGVRVRLGQALGVDVVLPLAAVTGEIVVTGEAPLVSVVSNQVATSFDRDFLDKAPLPRNFYNIIRSAPAVNIDYRQSSGSAMLAYGSTEERQNAFTIDGVNVADAGAGQHWVLPAIQWMEEIQVGGLGADAEYGGFTGGIINGVTKSGGNTFHGTVEYYDQPSSWVADNDPENDADEFKFSDASITLGGPVVRDALWFFVSAEYWNQVTTPIGAADTSDRTIPRFMGKLTWQLNQANRLMFMTEYDNVTNERRGVDAYVLAEAASKQEAPGQSFAVHWESLINDANFANFKATGYDGRDDYLPYHGTDVPGRNDYWGSELEWQNAAFQELNYRKVITLDASWSLFADGLLGADDSHAFKFGVLAENGVSSDVWTRNGGFTYYDDSTMCESLDAYFADPSCAVSDGYAFVETGYGEYNLHPKFSGLAAFAQDTLRFDRFTINVGLRYGAYEGGWQSGHGDSKVYDASFVDPRIGFVWDVTGDAGTAVKLHWGRYHEKIFTYMFDREVSGQGVVPDQDCYWSDADQGYTDCDEPVVQLGTMGKVDHPYADEWVVTVEHQLGEQMMLGFDFLDRRFRSIMAMVNVNDDYELYEAPDNPFGGGTLPVWDLRSDPEFVLTTDNGGYRDYQAAILRFEKRYADGWQLRSSLVWTDMKGNILKNNSYEAEFLDRNGFTNASGQMEKYSEWEYKLSGSVDLPLGFELSGQYTFLSGWYWTPYVRIRGLDFNASTGNYIWLTERGSEQLPDRSLIDLRLAWGTELGSTMRLTASLEVFNLMNEDTVLGVSGRWGDYWPEDGADGWVGPRGAFGTATSIETPRQIRAGIRFDF